MKTDFVWVFRKAFYIFLSKYISEKDINRKDTVISNRKYIEKCIINTV